MKRFLGFDFRGALIWVFIDIPITDIPDTKLPIPIPIPIAMYFNTFVIYNV